MVQSLEEYVSQATKAYQPTTTAIQAQINALPSQLESSNEQINRNYAQQQAGLNRQRNMAAETASMQAAGSGGSFGGASNIANRKYYDQAFVPAVTQMRANQTNELERARQANEDAKLSLSGQLANIQSQAQQQGLAQYYADLEAERAREAQLQAQREAQAAQLQLQREALAAQQAQNELIRQSAENELKRISLDTNRNIYGGFDWTDGYGTKYTVGQVAAKTGQDFNESLYKVLGLAANQGDYYSQIVANAIGNGRRFAQNTSGRSTGNNVLDTLGIVAVDGSKTYLNNGISF